MRTGLQQPDAAVPRPRLIVATGNGPEHRYVANRLCLALPVDMVMVDVAVRERSLRRAFRGGARAGVGRVGLELFRRVARDDAARDAALRRVLGKDLTTRFVAEDRLVRVQGMGSSDALAVVQRARPDLLLVYGTTFLRNEFLRQARDLAFNMHTGMSPYYRGTDCAFWPIAEGEPRWIGATVHECTETVDGGPIFAVEAADLDPNDGLHEVFARAVLKGANLYVDAVNAHLAGTSDDLPQDLSVGREYRGHMRTLGPELRARWRLRRGLLHRVGNTGSEAPGAEMSS